MLDGIREQLERQVARLLEEAERPMRVEEILPHLDPVMPTPNDVAAVLHDLASKREVERDGSFFTKPTPIPLGRLFGSDAQREVAARLIGIIREMDAAGGEGAGTAAILRKAKREGIPADRALDVLTILRNSGEVYSVGGDRMRLAKP